MIGRAEITPEGSAETPISVTRFLHRVVLLQMKTQDLVPVMVTVRGAECICFCLTLPGVTKDKSVLL